MQQHILNLPEVLWAVVSDRRTPSCATRASAGALLAMATFTHRCWALAC